MAGRIALIFNPTARGNKARRFLQAVEALSGEAELLPTQRAGHAADLAAEAAARGCKTLVAAGGDGTVNEVLSGLARRPEWLDQVRVGILPLGTMNVLARDLGIPMDPDRAWAVVREGVETRRDAPLIEFPKRPEQPPRLFAQLAGAGLDAIAVAEVKWEIKRCVGPLAYALAGWKAWTAPPRLVRVRGAGFEATASLVLLGNGKRYGGEVIMFPEADPQDGLVDVRIFPRVGLKTLASFALAWLLGRPLPVGRGQRFFRAAELTLDAAAPMPIQADGDAAGLLPVRVRVLPRKLRLLVPPGR